MTEERELMRNVAREFVERKSAGKPGNGYEGKYPLHLSGELRTGFDRVVYPEGWWTGRGGLQTAHNRRTSKDPLP